jgi:hypothetical protein
MLDKASLITSLPGRLPELLLPGSQWTKPSLDFDKRTPHNSRQVQYREPAPLQYQQAASKHKTDKPEMENQQQVCSNCVIHRGRTIRCNYINLILTRLVDTKLCQFIKQLTDRPVGCHDTTVTVIRSRRFNHIELLRPLYPVFTQINQLGT